jgi:hypothetical protein
VGVQWRPVHRLIALSAGPGGVAATVTDASLVADERLAGTKPVTVWAVLGCEDDPCAGSGAN